MCGRSRFDIIAIGMQEAVFSTNHMKDASVKIPLLGIPAAIYVTATLFLAVLYGINDPKQGIASAVTLIIGLILYPWFQYRISSSADHAQTMDTEQ